tara:strand:+ start:8853 stop:9014 length:162 start_codon:yes stop_codon:yes gene_type:complete
MTESQEFRAHLIRARNLLANDPGHTKQDRDIINELDRLIWNSLALEKPLPVTK